ncbi:hypothetical protein HW555_002301 [Spodoptera exigua]|uniref:Uncharacterized protein n=1 Tax=Spodoptera exigua TaxID=7107 RepID=A0A835GNF7_SPOEX|nr:hypothetical protein HW555_002301 [Spodoptera exigua]
MTGYFTSRLAINLENPDYPIDWFHHASYGFDGLPPALLPDVLGYDDMLVSRPERAASTHDDAPHPPSDKSRHIRRAIIRATSAER